MIQVLLGTNSSRNRVMTESNVTPKELLTAHQIEYASAQVHLDGALLSARDMNTSFEELGITETAMLIVVVKTENA